MLTTEVSQMEIYFRTMKNGKQRAYRVSRMQMRSFPMGLEEAKMLVATEQAVDIGRPFWATDVRSW